MAQFNENIKIVAPNPIDDRYLSLRTCAGSQLPYSADTEVFSTIPETVRYTGLTVLVQSGTTNVEYWFNNGIADINLIQKKYDSVIPIEDFITGDQLSVEGMFIDEEFVPAAFADRNYKNLDQTKPYISVLR